MKRNNLINLLNEYLPKNIVEIEAKNNILKFINKYENCFERSLSVGHITASAWLVDRNNEKAFLMLHKKLNKWLQPGGHCDGDPDVLDVAIKEAQEESGIFLIEPLLSKIFDVDIHEIEENLKEAAHLHYDIRFLLQVKSDEVAKKNNESI